MPDGVESRVRVLAERYEIGQSIGRGGMSDVYLGTDTRLGRQVAIKLLRSNLAEDPAFRARFRREAHDAAKMAHPTIVRIFDAGEEAVRDEDGTERLVPFIVMEYVDGRLLRDVLAEGPVDQKEAVRIAEQVLVALEYSHRAGVVHRDIKPGNIMIARNGQVKVMDFGIARAVSESAATLQETAEVIGTAQYFSPEQARGDTVDARTDLYSTGVVLFELLTGRPPFSGDNPVAVAYQHLNAEPPSPRSINPAVSPAVEAVVLRSLGKDPGTRYQTAAEFRLELRTAAAGQVPARLVPKGDEFSATLFGSAQAAQDAALHRLDADVEDRATRTQSGPPVIWVWAGIVVVVAIIAAVVYWIFTLQPPRLTEDLVVKVPDVIGKFYEDGVDDMEDAGLRVERLEETSETVEAGIILRTEPVSGTSVERGQLVEIVVSSGRTKVQIPDVARLDEASARTALEAAGFVPGVSSATTDPQIPGGQVVATNPAAGAFAARGDTIDLLISNGLVSVPDLRGQPTSAVDQLRVLGLDVNAVVNPGCTTGLIESQSLFGDIPQRSRIDVGVCVSP